MKILNERKVNHKTIIAQFDLEFDNWGLTIRKCKLMQGPKSGWFISYPCEMYEDKNDGNKKKYFSYIVFTKEKKDEIEKRVIEHFKTYINTAEPTSEIPSTDILF